MKGLPALLFLRLFGWLLARGPEWFPRGLTFLLANLIFHGLRKKQRILLANLTASWPEMSPAEIRSLAKESVARMVEFALLACAQPFFSDQRIRQSFHIPPETARILEETLCADSPKLVLSPHLGPQECLTSLPMLLPFPVGEVGVIYRPLDLPVLDRWIRATRERFGLKLISRKTSLPDTIGLLRRKGALVLLFDQSAGDERGGLMTFWQRPCTSTPLVGLLARKFHPQTFFLYARPSGFWKISFVAAEIPPGLSPDHLIFHAHQWLENLLREDVPLRSSWLWMHDRWKTRRDPRNLWKNNVKFDWREEQEKYLGGPPAIRPSAVLVYLPATSAACDRLIPYLQSLLEHRPDLRLIALGEAAEHFPPEPNIFAESIPLLDRGGSSAEYDRIAGQFPILGLCPVATDRIPRELALTRPGHTVGIVPNRGRKSGFTHPWHPPGELSEEELIDGFFRHLGYSPASASVQSAR